jgi:beta-galactosidase
VGFVNDRQLPGAGDLVRREVGAGTITTVGTLLDRATLAAVMTDAANRGAGRDAHAAIARPGASAILAARPASVTAHSLTGGRGRVWVVHNWSPHARTVRIAADAASVLDDAVHRAGTEVALAPWMCGSGGRPVRHRGERSLLLNQ